MRVRPIYVTFLFLGLAAVTANLAWATAINTTGPWFSPPVTMQVYSVALIAGTALAVLLTAFATSRAAALDREIRTLDTRVEILRSLVGLDESPKRQADGNPGVDADLRVILGSIREANVVRTGGGQESLLAVPEIMGIEDPGSRAIALAHVSGQRTLFEKARRAVWRTIAGPVLLGVLFVAIAGAMLPGSEGFASAQFQLNTLLVLFVSYGFGILLAWSLVAIAMTQLTWADALE